MTRISRFILLAGLLAGATACSDSLTEALQEQSPKTIVEIAADDPRFTTLVTALRDTGLDDALSQPGPFTVLAPTDDAFALLPAGLVGGLSNDDLTQVLLYHVIDGDLKADAVKNFNAATTRQGSDVAIQLVDGTIVLNGRVQVTTGDIEASNGVIHVIDAVLLPGDFPGTIVDALAASPRFSTLAGAVTAAGLAGTLGGQDLTVLAPTDDAFARLPAGLVAGLSNSDLVSVLAYHAIDDEVRAADVVSLDSAKSLEGAEIAIQVFDAGVVLNGRAQVTYTDIAASNGVIHVIDAVLMPGDFLGTIVDALAASPRFDTLVAAVGAEDLVTALASDNGGAGFTVFAPTNDAFARLPDGLVDEVATAGSLSTVLLYHVLGAEVDSSAAVGADGATVGTLATDANDDDATFELGVDLDDDLDLFLDGRTQVTFVDIRARNGIIHVLDSVLIPGGNFPGSLVEALTSYPRFDSLVGAVVAAQLAGSITDVTVFAPTNDAFATFELGGLDLVEVLTYHVLASEKDSTMLGSSEVTVEGSALSIDTSMGVVIDGSAKVVRADILADDGTIHVIDEVLVPGP